MISNCNRAARRYVGRRTLTAFCRSQGGNFAAWFAVGLTPIFLSVGMAVEYADALRVKAELQSKLDAAVLAGAAAPADKQAVAQLMFSGVSDMLPEAEAPLVKFMLGEGVLDGELTWQTGAGFATALFGKKMPIRVTSQATFAEEEPTGPCISVLSNSAQALLVNSGANVQAPGCEMQVHSTQNPAFTMNAGSTLTLDKLCVKGFNYLRNGGTISRLETNCDVAADPYFKALPEPAVSSTCTTSGAKDGTNHTLNPGVHCYVNFNGSPTVTFKPGLHIIKGQMNINSGATVIAEGVTFYFPDTDSRIQANGGLTMRATAPASGTHAGILMFEKTTDSSNNANKRQFIFNGSVSEYLEGLIYLPNRDVVYNSTTNVGASKIRMLVNTMILNTANWKFETYAGTGTGQPKTVFLSR